MEAEWDVVIVGFGPGGEVAASLLGQAGHRVLSVDKAPAPFGQPRMSTLDGEIARVLQHAADPAEAMVDAIPARGIKLLGADDMPVPPIDWDYRIGGHWSHYSLHQPNIEAAMERRIASCPSVEVRWGWKADGIEERGDHVAVTLQGPAVDGDLPAPQVHRARYVLGFDGASSFVRQAAGIGLEVIHEHDDRWILTDFDALRPLPPQLQQTQFHMRPERAWFSGPNGANRCRTDVRVLPGEDLAVELAEEKGYEFLERHFGVTREDVRLTRRIAYRFRSHIARSFRRGRVFIGGDAAHAMTPYMGQGACCAMRDAANIAWKLGLVLRGAADECLLETYEPERRPHSLFFVHGSLATWAFVNETDAEKAAARDAAVRAQGGVSQPIPGLEAGLVRRSASGELAPGAGTLAPQGVVRLGSREGLLDDLVGYGGQLISRLPVAELLGDERQARLAELGIHVMRVVGSEAGENEIADLDGTYRDAWSSLHAVALLARPDHYLFGVAESPEDISALADDFLAQVPRPDEARGGSVSQPAISNV